MTGTFIQNVFSRDDRGLGDAALRDVIRGLPRRARILAHDSGGWTPANRIISAGIERRHHAEYAWSHLQRPDIPMGIIQFTVAGSGRLAVGGREYRCEPGTAMLVVARDAHRYWLPPGGDWTFAFVSLVGTDCVAGLRVAIARAGPVQAVREHGTVLPRFRQCLHRALGPVELRPGQSGELALGVIDALVVDAGLGRAVDPRIERGKRRLREHLLEPIRLDAVAKELGMSRSGFCAAFTAQVGMAPGRWQREARLHAAAAELAAGVSAKDAAEKMGFQDPAYFGRAFRREFGMSPGAWRRLR